MTDFVTLIKTAIENVPQKDGNGRIDVQAMAEAAAKVAVREAAKIAYAVNNYDNPMTATDVGDAILSLVDGGKSLLDEERHLRETNEAMKLHLDAILDRHSDLSVALESVFRISSDTPTSIYAAVNRLRKIRDIAAGTKGFRRDE